MILEQLDELLAQAIKNKEIVRISTLRMMKTKLTSASKVRNQEYTSEIEESELRKLIKQNYESIEAYKANDDQLTVDQLTEEISIIEEFLPKLMSIEEINAYINSIEGVKEMKVNDLKKILFKDLKGKADSKDINTILKDW